MKLEAQAISAGYASELVFSDVSFEFPSGKITTLVGPNGCGKSTLLKSLGRILTLKTGTVYLDGSDIHRLPSKELARKMAILPQTPQTPDGITVEELLSYGRFPHQKAWHRLSEEDQSYIDWALKVCELETLRDKDLDHLSGGQRQRAWIGMALAQQSSIILLDEPTTYLDMTYQLEVLELLEQLNKKQGSTIIMVLHDLNMAARFSDYLVGMRDGELIARGSPREVLTPEHLRNIFQVDAQIVEDPRTGSPVVLSYSRLEAGKETTVTK